MPWDSTVTRSPGHLIYLMFNNQIPVPPYNSYSCSLSPAIVFYRDRRSSAKYCRRNPAGRTRTSENLAVVSRIIRSAKLSSTAKCSQNESYLFSWKYSRSIGFFKRCSVNSHAFITEDLFNTPILPSCTCTAQIHSCLQMNTMYALLKNIYSE